MEHQYKNFPFLWEELFIESSILVSETDTDNQEGREVPNSNLWDIILVMILSKENVLKRQGIFWR